MKLLLNTLQIALIFLAIDFGAMMLWFTLGQVPAGNFFLGTISYHILQAILY